MNTASTPQLYSDVGDASNRQSPPIFFRVFDIKMLIKITFALAQQIMFKPDWKYPILLRASYFHFLFFAAVQAKSQGVTLSCY